MQCPGVQKRYLLTVLSSILTACGDGISSTPATPENQVLFSITAEPHALTMAVNDTARITLTARDIAGNLMTIPDTLPIQLRSDNVDQVVTGPNGMVVAKDETPYDQFLGAQPVLLIASWTYADVKRVDTVYVAVTPTAPADPIAKLSLLPQPYPQDSTWIGAIMIPRVIPTTVTTIRGDTIPRAIIYLHTQRRRAYLPEFIHPIEHLFNPFFPAGTKVWMYGTGQVYGVMLRDSAQYLVTDPVVITTTISQDLRGRTFITGDSMNIQPCGFIGFTNSSNATVNITFDDPDPTVSCLDGDEIGPILNLKPGADALRKIRVSGRHRWTVTRANGESYPQPLQGVIRVRAPSDFLR